jgi:ATP-binding cassette subfamily B (MDR/TAP) protein 1
MTTCAARGPEYVPFRMTCNAGETITSSGSETLAFWTLFCDMTGQARLNSFLNQFESNGSKAKCTIGLATIYVSTQAVFQGVMGASQIASPVTSLTKAATACREVLRVISRIPPIDAFNEDGLKPEHVRGEIEVRDVWFAYPSSPAFHICQGYSLSIPAGSSCALVGPSGSGKSTIVQLLERYYDPLSGAPSCSTAST